jgi:hypothetical protein
MAKIYSCVGNNRNDYENNVYDSNKNDYVSNFETDPAVAPSETITFLGGGGNAAGTSAVRHTLRIKGNLNFSGLY